MKSLPVFFINGMLESGKTTFIIDTIKSDDYYKKGKTLILACEQGEIEYRDDFLKLYNTEVVYFDNQEDFTSLKLQEEVLRHNPNRVVIEFNGMWDLKQVQFPDYFRIYQCIYFINYETFPIYFNNMRQQFLDAVKQSDVTVFINVKDKQEELQSYSSSFKLSNSQGQFMKMNEEGQLEDAFEVELPYDINADVIKVENKDFGIYYIDTFDHKERYEGKVVDFNAMVVISDKLPKKTFIAGRLAMTCCSNDIQLYGHLCIDNASFKLKNKTFVHIIAKMKYEYSDEYQEDEMVLYPLSIEKIDDIKDPVLDLTK